MDRQKIRSAARLTGIGDKERPGRHKQPAGAFKP